MLSFSYRMMTKHSVRYAMLFVCAVVLTACFPEYQDQGKDDIVPFDGDVLRFEVTLDRMGGMSTKSGSVDAKSLEDIESYVDPEKFRVLVFDSEDEFLFESKSRWIKQLDPESSHSIWSVAIPLYSYGNDREYEGLWEDIRDKLTSGPFKIAILANRPEVDNFPEMTGNVTNEGDGSNRNTPTWFDNSGPNWGAANSAVKDGHITKTVFDLHHSQYDPIYEDKGGASQFGGKNVYAMIMGKGTVGGSTRPFLSATSSWVQFGDDKEDAKGRYYAYASENTGYNFTNMVDNTTGKIRDSLVSDKNMVYHYYKDAGWGKNRDPRGWNFRKTRLPDKNYPIPMYGIQLYDALTDWKKGTVTSLNRENDKPISLLRSVVKLELVIPEEYEPTDVVLFYSNIYARCEPMDVWTPTDQIWADANEPHPVAGKCDEMEAIQALGLMTELDQTYTSSDASYTQYQKKIARLYGRWWEEKKWGEESLWKEGAENTYSDEIIKYLKSYSTSTKRKFPRIFNPCIQRNTAVYVEPTYKDELGVHYIVYTGERNINDPSQLYNIANLGSGNPTLLYWSIIYGTGEYSFLGDGEGSTTYSFPVVDYDGTVNDEPAEVLHVFRKGEITQRTSQPYYIIPANSPRDANNFSGAANGNGMGDYLRRVQGQNLEKEYTLQDRLNGKAYSKKDWPLPLIRNHVYKITLSATKSGEGFPFAPRLEEMHTPDICFKK